MGYFPLDGIIGACSPPSVVAVMGRALGLGHFAEQSAGAFTQEIDGIQERIVTVRDAIHVGQGLERYGQDIFAIALEVLHER